MIEYEPTMIERAEGVLLGKLEAELEKRRRFHKKRGTTPGRVTQARMDHLVLRIDAIKRRLGVSDG